MLCIVDGYDSTSLVLQMYVDVHCSVLFCVQCVVLWVLIELNAFSETAVNICFGSLCERDDN